MAHTRITPTRITFARTLIRRRVSSLSFSHLRPAFILRTFSRAQPATTRQRFHLQYQLTGKAGFP